MKLRLAASVFLGLVLASGVPAVADTNFTVKTKEQLLSEFQSCKDQNLPGGCITPDRLRDLIGSTATLDNGGLSGLTYGNLLNPHPSPFLTGLSGDANKFIVSSSTDSSLTPKFFAQGGVGDNYNGMQSIISIPLGSTINNVNGVGSYIINNTNTLQPGACSISTCGAGVNFYAVGIAQADYSAVWGFNPVMSDTAVPTAPTSGVGKYLYGAELDFNNTSTGTTIHGVDCTGSSSAQPQFSTCLRITPLNVFSGAFPWTYAVQSQDGAATVALEAGAVSASGSNKNSQSIVVRYFDVAGAAQNYSLIAVPGSGLEINGTALKSLVLFGDLKMPDSSSVLVGGDQLQTVISHAAYWGLGAGITSIAIGNNVAPITLRGGVTLTSDLTMPNATSITIGGDQLQTVIAHAAYWGLGAGITSIAIGNNVAPITLQGPVSMTGAVSMAGHLRVTGPSATIASGFGTSPSILGSDTAGRVTVGTGGAASGIITFTGSFSVAPSCWANDETTSQLMRATATTTTLTITGTMTGADKVTYGCIAYL